MIKFVFFILFFINLNASLVEVNDSININVLPHSSILIPEKNLSLSQAITNENWKITKKNIINFGYSTTLRWIKFDIKKYDSSKIFLEYGLTSVDIINVYIVNKNKLIKEYKTGINKEFDSRPINSNKFIFPIDIEKDDTYICYYLF